MAYVTVQNLADALKDAGGAGARTAAELPAPRLQVNVDEAAAEVVGRLSGRFTLPEAGTDPAVSPETTPPLLRTVIIGIAGYLATLEFYGSQPVEERDPVVLRYARARELLAQIARGDLTVPGLPPISGTSPTGDAAIFQPYAGNLNLAGGFLHPSYGGHAAPHSGGITWE